MTNNKKRIVLIHRGTEIGNQYFEIDERIAVKKNYSRASIGMYFLNVLFALNYNKSKSINK